MAELGLSVITVNRIFSTDFSRTFYELDKLGIRNLEFKTFFGYDAKTLKKSMDFYGMKSLGTHERKRDLRDLELLKRIIEYHQIQNTKYIIYTLGAVNIQSEIDALIDDLNNAGRILKENGLELLYHNHAREYEKMPNGQYKMDYVLERVDPEYANLELDVLYLNGGNGVDVKPYMERMVDRIKVVHVKDGIVDFRRTDLQDDFMCCVGKPVGDGIVQIQETVDFVNSSEIPYMLIENEAPSANCFEEVKMSRDRLFEHYGFKERTI